MTQTLRRKLTELIFTTTGADVADLGLEHVTSIRGLFGALEATGYGNYGDEFFRETFLTSIGSWGIRKCDIGDGIRAALFEEWSGNDYIVEEKWKQVLYRGKAIACLLLERWSSDGYSLEDVDVVAWNEQELRVGIGLRNWHVFIEHQNWP